MDRVSTALALGVIGTAAFVLPKALRGKAYRWRDTPPLGALIETRGLVAFHSGVYIGTYRDIDRAVVHCKKWDRGRVDSLEDWAPSGQYWITSQPYPSPEIAVRRALAVVDKPYNLIEYNCEHCALWASTGRRASPQLQQAAWLGFILGGGFLLFDASTKRS